MAQRWIAFSGLLVLFVFLATIPLPRVDGHLVGSDGTYYYSLLRSAVFDHDLDVRNDCAQMGVKPYATTPIGRAGWPFAVGTPMLWLPFYLLAHGLSACLVALGARLPLDGTGSFDEAFVCSGTLLYAGAGLILVFRAARRLFRDPFAAALGALGMWWATSLIEYTVAEPSMSHGMSFFANALFLDAWFRPGAQPTRRRLALLGACAGLVALVRTQEGIIILLPLVELARHGVAARRPVAKVLIDAACLLGVFAIACLPQVYVWHSVYGVFLTVPQGDDFMRWGSPHAVRILFSTRHGLISWHPVILLALFGLFPLWRRDRALTLTILGLFLAQLYVNSAVSQWWAGDAFGGRRFSGMLPWLALPLAALVASVGHRSRRGLALAATLALLTAWNGLAFMQYRFGLVSRAEALSWREMTVERLALPLTLGRRLLRR